MAKKTGAEVPRAPVLKQRFNVYTMMLMLSFFALVTGTVMLHLELDRFKESPESKAWWWDTSAVQNVPK